MHFQYCCGVMSDGYDYSGASHVLGISTDDCRLNYICDGNTSATMTTLGRGLFMCPSVKWRERHLATAAEWGPAHWAVVASWNPDFHVRDGKCLHKLDCSGMFAELLYRVGQSIVFGCWVGNEALLQGLVSHFKCSVNGGPKSQPMIWFISLNYTILFCPLPSYPHALWGYSIDLNKNHTCLTLTLTRILTLTLTLTKP